MGGALMKRDLNRFGRRLFVVAIVCALCAPLLAQDPFGEPAAPEPAVQKPPVAGEIEKPGAVPAKDPAAAPAKKAEPPVDPSQYILPIRAVLESDPQTPVELMRAITVLVDLGEPDLARPYVSKLHAATLDDAALAELVRRVGSGPFLRIAAEKALDPEGREFGERAMNATGRQARDPKRLAELVDQLSDPSPERQRQALAELLGAHEFAVPPLVTALNDPAKRAMHPRAIDALTALAEDAVGPLLATLHGPDSPAKLAAIEALVRMRASEAAPHFVGLYLARATSPQVRSAAEDALFVLYGKTPTPREAVRFLETEIVEVLSGRRLLPVGVDGRMALWLWDSAKSQPVPATVSADQARSQLALRLASRLIELSPNEPQHRRLYLISLLEAEAYRGGLDNAVDRGKGSAFATAAGMGIEAVEDALSYSIENGYAPAATVAVQVLAEIGDAATLLRGGAEPSPLAIALTHGDARLRFAAAQAIVQLKPQAPFAGLSYLKSTLVHFATSAGQRRALIGFPNGETAQQLAGMTNQLGLSTQTATNGSDLLLEASKAAAYELILVSGHIDRGPLYQVVQDLRRHPHTIQTPIIVLAEDDEAGSLRHRLRDDLLTSVALRPRSLEGMQYAVDQARRRAGDRIIPAEVREAQANAAINSIAALMEAAPKVFDFREDERVLAPLLYSPSQSAATARLLAQLGTHTSQQSLLDIVNRATQPMPSRQAAAAAFGDSVRRFGVRLTKGEILKQYDRYNQSRVEHEASQTLLGATLDAIELRSRINEPESAGTR
jgi:CheY-like chemotaxis protein